MDAAKRVAGTEIPRIDIGALVATGAEGAVADVSAQIRAASLGSACPMKTMNAVRRNIIGPGRTGRTGQERHACDLHVIQRVHQIVVRNVRGTTGHDHTNGLEGLKAL